MSIRTTVTLDDDVFARLKEASATRGVPFRQLLNDVVRSGLLRLNDPSDRPVYRVKPVSLGIPSQPNLDDISAVIEAAEGDRWR